jgi:hypothetical protein
MYALGIDLEQETNRQEAEKNSKAAPLGRLGLFRD